MSEGLSLVGTPLLVESLVSPKWGDTDLVAAACLRGGYPPSTPDHLFANFYSDPPRAKEAALAYLTLGRIEGSLRRSLVRMITA